MFYLCIFYLSYSVSRKAAWQFLYLDQFERVERVERVRVARLNFPSPQVSKLAIRREMYNIELLTASIVQPVQRRWL